MSRSRRSLFFLLAAALAAVDLWSKGLWTYPGEPRILIRDWLVIEPVFNPGGVWSLPLPPVVLLVTTALAVPAIVLWTLLPVRAGCAESVGKQLVLGGALGNLYDRVRFGQVRDFISVYYGDLQGKHWPTFNVADASLLVGIGILLLAGGRREAKPA